MRETLVGFGGNVGDVRTTIARAISAFCDGREVRLLARSSDYCTPPWGVTDQPPFVNACVAAETRLSPRMLLHKALAVERAFGRERTGERRWGPRTIDIDLLALGDLVLNEPGLVLPHPRLLDRPFVLVPLAEIRPHALVAGTRVGDALARIDVAGVERLPPR